MTRRGSLFNPPYGSIEVFLSWNRVVVSLSFFLFLSLNLKRSVEGFQTPLPGRIGPFYLFVLILGPSPNGPVWRQPPLLAGPCAFLFTFPCILVGSLQQRRFNNGMPYKVRGARNIKLSKSVLSMVALGR
jgi:hypothetical protein